MKLLNEDPSELRMLSRYKVSIPVTIEWGDSPIDCVMREISGTGARLVIPDDALLPQTFILNLKTDSRRNCKVVRRDGGEVGVEFIAAAA